MKRRDQLAVRQAWITVFSTLLLGLVFSGVLLLFEYRHERQLLVQSTGDFLSILDQPAAIAAHQQDETLALELRRRYLSYKPLYSVHIQLVSGDPLMDYRGVISQGPFRTLIDLLYGETYSVIHALSLTAKSTGQLEQVGTLDVSIDTYDTGIMFLDRAFRILVTSLASSASLALLLLWVYHRFLTRPFVLMVQQTQMIDPEHPGAVRLQPPQFHEQDEFGLLTGNINRMLSAIEVNVQARINRVREAERLRTQMAAQQTKSFEMQAYQDELLLANDQLAKTVKELEETQEALVESKTLASLGGLVAGVAHELNTPLGVAVTSASYLVNRVEELKQLYGDRQMTEADFDQFMEKVTEISGVLEINLNRAAQLIRSFKQVAVDQTRFVADQVDLGAYLKTVIQSLSPEIKGSGVTVTLDCPKKVEIHSFPGALAQVIVNLLQNALRHGFADRGEGDIRLQVACAGDQVHLTFEDNGKGISPGDLSHVFEPFYTTQKGKGGTGLGLNIVYNLVHQKLQGRVTVESEVGVGTKFTIILPFDGHLPDGV